MIPARLQRHIALLRQLSLGRLEKSGGSPDEAKQLGALTCERDQLIALIEAEKARSELLAAACFDHRFYRRYYADLAEFCEIELENHYLAHGRDEGRLPNPPQLLRVLQEQHGELPSDWDPDEYLCANLDLIPFMREPWELAVHYLNHGRDEGRPLDRLSTSSFYDERILHNATGHAYDMPEVLVDPHRPAAVNVLVPAFDFGSMSAGFFGVFQVALFIRRCGLHVRLVLYDRFDFDLNASRIKLQGYPGMETALDDLEVEYIGDRQHPLRISPNDSCVATVWYSAYLARKLMAARGGGSFLYLIQDYEPAFHPSGSNFALAEATYSFDYIALFSTKALQDFFLRKSVGHVGRPDTRFDYFNNACSSKLPERDAFIAAGLQRRPRRLAFYSRPAVSRNMFELGVLTLCAAQRAGVFPLGQWEFIGIGLGKVTIQLDEDTEIKQMERMNLREYEEVIATFDVGLCLMASSHPSLLPFDLSGSGVIVVTNSFGVKDQDYFDELTQGVIVSPPDVPALVEAMRRAVRESDDLALRHRRAAAMTYPRDWQHTFEERHVALIRQAFHETLQATRGGP